MKKNGRMELIADLANPLPILVVIELLGADPERAEDLKRWSRGIVAKATRRLSPDEKEATSVGFRQLTAYLEQHIERCRSRRHPGILGDLLASAKEERLTPKEALSFARLLLVAGTETTTHLIGNTVLALLGNPAEMEKVRTTPELVSDLVEEALRHTSPVQFVYRAARRTMELSGARIPAGALVAVLLGSANRDPEQFPEPDRFLVSRSPRHHLGFGIGPHSCLGAQIARLESRIVLEELLSLPGKVRALQPPDSVELIESVQMRGPKRLTLMSADVTF
jgi:cytochrome P450